MNNESDRLGIESSHNEANIIQDRLAPEVKELVGNYLKGKGDEASTDLLKSFGETAYLEMANNQLGNIKKERPWAYSDLMEYQASLAEAVELDAPSYLDSLNRADVQIRSRQDRREFVASASETERAGAFERSRDNCRYIVGISVNEMKEPPISTSRRSSGLFREATRCVLKNSSDGEQIGEIPSVLGNLVAATVSLYNFRLGMRDFSVNVDFKAATAKQENYNKSVATIAPKS